MSAIVLHRHPLSGHSHRVELMLALLDLPARLVDVDLVTGEQKTPPFVAKNAFAQVPVLEDDGVVLPDSAAILVYLIRRYADDGTWLPRDPVLAAEVQRWLSLAAGPLVAGAATARIAAVFGRAIDVEGPRAIARQLFQRMNDHLATRSFLVSDRVTIADVAMYTYTAHAPEGGVSLEPFPHLKRWLARIEALPRFVPMKATATAERAKAS